MLGCENAIKSYRTSAVEYLFGKAREARMLWVYAISASLFVVGILVAFPLARMIQRSLRSVAAGVHSRITAHGRENELKFHPELFPLRTTVLERLAKNDVVWLSDFGAVDLRHDIYGLEVTAIRTEEIAAEVERLVSQMFPTWRYHRSFYEEHNVGELGWKVIISRDREDYEDEAWKSSG